jgi:hypothetical protein
MKNHFWLTCLGAFFAAFLLSQCCFSPTNNNFMPTGTPAPNEGVGIFIELTPTSTPTIALPDPKTQAPPEKLSGTLEMHFPDPWERPEFCSSEVPYMMILSDGTYHLSGEGIFYCYQVMTYEEGGGLKQHLEQDYQVSLTGQMPLEPGSILQMTVTMTGAQECYYSDYPNDAPEMITAANPFQVDINQPLALKFQYDEEAYCLWNEKGVLTNLPDDEPPTGETGWLFILHPGK